MSRRKSRTHHSPEPAPDGNTPQRSETSAKVTIRLTGPERQECVPILPARISDHLQDKGAVLFVRIQDAGPEELEMLREEFGFHRLALEDASRQKQRPKADEYPGYYFVVIYSPLPAKADEPVQMTEIDLFVGRNYVVALHPGEIPAMDEALQRWERTDPDLRHNAGFLLHTVVDAVIDAYFPVVDAIEDRLDEVEIDIFSSKDTSSEDLLDIKRNLFTLRKATYPMRDVFNLFLRRDGHVFNPDTHPYFQDVYDHVLRLLDIIDIQREMAASALDAQLAVTSNRLNETMKRLTVITICVAILGAVFGAWGMNFTHVPLDSLGLTGFVIVTGGAFLLVVVALAWAKRRELW